VVPAVLLAIALIGCGSMDPPLTRLERVYQDGLRSRASLQAHGLTADKQRCKDMYQASDAEERLAPSDNPEFQHQHFDYFTNGCLGLPRPGATPLPSSTVTPSASVSP